jgi:hypothetical protein
MYQPQPSRQTNKVTPLHTRRRADAFADQAPCELPVILPIDDGEFAAPKRPASPISSHIANAMRAQAHMSQELRHRDELKAVKLDCLKRGFSAGFNAGRQRGFLAGVLIGMALGGGVVTISILARFMS